MENGEVVLEVGREELALDRPPVTSLLSSSPKNLQKVFLQNAAETSNIANKESLIEKREGNENKKDGQGVSTSKFEVVVQEDDDDDGGDLMLDDGVCAIEANEFEMVEANAEDTTVKEECSDVIPDINASSTASSGVSKLNIESKTKSDKKQVRYFNGKPLTSCLKLPPPPDGTLEMKKGKRSVHYFGDEKSCVKEYIEPVDPWKDVRTPPKAEVVSFYRNSCQKLRCKPIDKVFKQILDAPDLSCRAGTLVLRGSRLDSKSCEALESVFRRVQFENLDLENCSMEEDGSTSLLEMIEFYHSTCKLNIACNPKIGMRGWQALCRMLRKTPCLTYLDARRTLLTDMTMPTFGRCLKADPPLKILHLESVFLSGRPMLILTTAMKYNKILEELYLGDNDLSSSDGPPIGAMLTYNTTLQLLDLRNNQIKDIGLAHVGNGLSDQSELCQGGLCSLILWNNGLTHEGMGYLSDGLVQTNSLKALNLGQNRIGDLGIQKLKIGLMRNKSLHKLGFLNTKLGSEGAVALAEVLADSLTITRIDIRENNIQTAGLMAFAMALKVNHSLLRLDLDKDIKKEAGMEQVMQTVLVDIYNFCHRNKQMARQQFQGAPLSLDHVEMSRQSSTSSDVESHINTDDIFHPETGKQDLTPFSPVYTDPKDIPINFASMYISKEDGASASTSSPVSTSSPSTTHNPIPPLVDVNKSTQKEILDAISSEGQGLPKDEQSVHILNKPTLDSSDRRASRFSVTKILDSLGNHAAGVANKLVNATTTKQAPPTPTSKDKPASDMFNTELENISSQSNNSHKSTAQAVAIETMPFPKADSAEQSNSLTSNETNDKMVNIESEGKVHKEGETTENVSILELASQHDSNDCIETPEHDEDEIHGNNIENEDGLVKESETINAEVTSTEDKEIFLSLETADKHVDDSDGDSSEYRNKILSPHPIPVDSPS